MVFLLLKIWKFLISHTTNNIFVWVLSCLSWPKEKKKKKEKNGAEGWRDNRGVWLQIDVTYLVICQEQYLNTYW